MVEFYEGLGDELSLYVRQLAWLGTAPKDPKTRKLANAASDPAPQTRLERMKADGLEPMLPDCSAPHLIEHLLEVGPFEVTGMERVPISWRELQAWQDQTGVALDAWQARLLRRLSSDYLSSSRAAEKLDCPAPWATSAPEDNRDAIARRIDAIFGSRTKEG